MTLRETLANKSFEDVHLVHDAVDNDPATIVELHSNTLTEAGKEAWQDVLDAEVQSIFTGIYGLQIQLCGVKASRLDDFSMMLAGYCSAINYDKWVTPDQPEKPNNEEATIMSGLIDSSAKKSNISERDRIQEAIDDIEKTIIKIVTINVYDAGDLKGYADGVITVGERNHDFLYRIDDDPDNGPGDTIVSIDWGFENPLVENQWCKIRELIRKEVIKR